VRRRSTPTPPPPGEEARVLSPYAAAQMRIIMRQTVTDGTGRLRRSARLSGGGKTGTAEKAAPGGGYLDDKRARQSFVAAFPAWTTRLCAGACCSTSPRTAAAPIRAAARAGPARP
jgi:cell division protein FtsI/penicillin-binding protein 2